ncbi:MAG: hypothetical protein RSA01_03420 [Clostridium sp.]|uniref:hypothetical protein n=1 Tax=Clostridium sp. TaxID=1506 RepID=UPI002FC93F5D
MKLNRVNLYFLNQSFMMNILLALLAVLSIFLHPIFHYGQYITAFLVTLIVIIGLIAPILRFKSLMFGRSRIIFLTPKKYGYIIRGFIYSEIAIFATLFLGIAVCLYSIDGKVLLVEYFMYSNSIYPSLPYYSTWLFIRTVDIWFNFLAVGILSVVFSKIYLERLRFVLIKIFLIFSSMQFLSIVIVEILNVIMNETVTRMIISLYAIYLAYRKLQKTDIY